MVERRRRPNELKIGAALSYATVAVHSLVALLYTPLMLRLLGQSEYGLYSLVASVVSYLGLLSFGFGSAYMRFYARFRVMQDSDGIRRLNGMFLVVFSVIGLAACIGGSILTLNVQFILGSQFSVNELDTAEALFAILTVNLAITFPTSVFSSYITAHERFIFQKSMQVLKAITSPLVVLPVLLLGYQSIGMALATTLVNVAFTVSTVAFSWRHLKMRFSFRRFDFLLFREVWVFSSYLFINTVVTQISWNVDKFIIGRFHGAIPVAVYGVAALFNAHYSNFSTAISNVFVPRIHTLVANATDTRELSSLFARVGRVQFLVLGLVMSGFIFFGMPFIDLWAGRDYREAYFIALLLMAPMTLSLLQDLGVEIQKAKNMHQFRSWVYLGVAMGNLLLSIPLTQRYQGIGAAAATAIALLIGNVLAMNWYYSARIGLDISAFWSDILRLSLGMIPALVGGAVIVAFADLSQISLLIVFVFVYFILYVLGMWKFGMNNYERQIIGAPVRSVLTRLWAS